MEEAALPGARACSASSEPAAGTDRPGNDFSISPVAGAGPAACAAACSFTAHCDVYTYCSLQSSGVFPDCGPPGACYIGSSNVSTPVPNTRFWLGQQPERPCTVAGPPLPMSQVSGLTDSPPTVAAATAADCAQACCDAARISNSCSVWQFSTGTTQGSGCWYNASKLTMAAARFPWATTGWWGGTSSQCAFDGTSARPVPGFANAFPVVMPGAGSPGATSDMTNLVACAQACCLSNLCDFWTYCPIAGAAGNCTPV
jgi:hypothetical protein